MKVIVDSLGGDKGPKEAIIGCALALKDKPDLELVIVGDKALIEKEMAEAGGDLSRVEIIQANESVLNTDHPANFLREKPNCSLALLYEAAKNRNDIQAIVSAGPTGAVLSGAIFKLGRIKGVKRPALLASFPTKKNTMVRVLDAGANMDCKPEYLLQFGIMANAYAKATGIESPKVGLLNVGSEEGKGNQIVKETFELLKNANLDFIGNVEADHVMDGEADVVVADGFWGNVYTKATEGTAMWTAGLFKEAFYKNILTKLGALLVKKQVKEATKPLIAAKKASAPLLGVNKPVLKCHGRADRDSFHLTILEAEGLIKQDLIKKIEKGIEEAEIPENN